MESLQFEAKDIKTCEDGGWYVSVPVCREFALEWLNTDEEIRFDKFEEWMMDLGMMCSPEGWVDVHFWICPEEVGLETANMRVYVEPEHWH